MPFDPDRPIIEEIRNGRPRRFAVLVDRHKDRALTLAIRMVGNREEAEELVQDSFIRAFRSLAEFRGDARFGTWFYRIVYNICLTKVMRRPGRAAIAEMEGQEEDGLGEVAAPEEETDALKRLEDAEFGTLLRRAIDRLPENQRTAITLFYVQEMTYEEIAEVTGQPMGSVKTHLFRGRETLRRNVLQQKKGRPNIA
jgi:RNA polymerase sigma-70 factor (ECF subfamily)